MTAGVPTNFDINMEDPDASRQDGFDLRLLRTR
jgi:hypothetical protein